ncbi:MAG: iron export ABC transporter permease subunit FetB [Bacillota bacterium]|nr:iron export ABC transporter permease subunit FetB [Bacillota bacterium]
MTNNLQIDLYRLAAAYVFVIILLFIVRRKGISREKEIILASFRMTVQLVLVGYLLVYIFEANNPFYIILMTLVMEAFAVRNVIKRSKRNLSKELKKVITFSIVTSTILCLIYFLAVVLNIKPWYDPKSFIPIAGMLIGNSMTGISLGVNKLLDGMYAERNLIEGALMLGARPKDAAKGVVDSAFDSAIIPTINSMLGMGIVFLPGMMTGQILSGLSPLIATKYQIAIMLGILGSVSLSVILFVQLGYKTFFNDKDQFVLGLEEEK